MEAKLHVLLISTKAGDKWLYRLQGKYGRILLGRIAENVTGRDGEKYSYAGIGKLTRTPSLESAS